MPGLCDGRVAIVTGAGRGIGRAHALALASEGARVVVNDVGVATDGEGTDATPAEEVAGEIRAQGGVADVNYDDVADWTGAKSLIEQAIGRYGALDVLINNAGILRDRMVFSMSERDWDDVIRVHLKGTFATTHHAASYWRELSKAGAPRTARIINTSSPSGIYGNVGQSNYGAAKAGIAAFTIITAMELQRYGVTVNCVSPGAFTRMTADLPGFVEMTPEEQQAMGPEWIAAVATWLASEHSSHVTGKVFDVVGNRLGLAEGWSLGPRRTQTGDATEIGGLVDELLAEADPYRALPLNRDGRP